MNWADMSGASNHWLVVTLAATRGLLGCCSGGCGYFLAASEPLHKRRLGVLSACRAADHVDDAGFLKKKEDCFK
jgi:hypothetical protein